MCVLLWTVDVLIGGTKDIPEASVPPLFNFG